MGLATGQCKSWTLDRGLDHGLDHGLDCGLEYGLSVHKMMRFWKVRHKHRSHSSVVIVISSDSEESDVEAHETLPSPISPSKKVFTPTKR